MTRRYRSKVLLGVFSIVLLIFGQPYTEAASVKVCGEAATDSEAREDARRKAVDSILLKMQVHDDIKQQIQARYADYASMPEVVAKKKQKGRVYLISNVQVDTEAITRKVQELGECNQKKQVDLSACFLIRIQGIDEAMRASRGLRRVMDVCSDTFQQRGFSTGIADGLVRELLRYPGNYETFCQAMQQKIQRDYPEITVAIVGEIVLADKKQEADACTRGATVRIYALDVLKQRVIAEYEESYRARGSTEDEADIMVLQKAALNATETLAAKALDYYGGGI